MPSDSSPDRELVSRLVLALQTTPLRLAVVFGSTARGRRRVDSDVDVAILPPDSRFDDSSELALARALSLSAGAEVDLVRLDAASTLLKWHVATEGVPLIEATPGEFARFQARAAAEYLEYAPALAHHGEVFRRRLLEQRRGR